MINQLLNICLQFVEVNALFDKLSRPEAKINLEDLDCLDCDEYRDVPFYCEDEFLALENMAQKASDLWAKPEGSPWAKFERMRKVRRDIDALQAKIDSIERGESEIKPVWEP